MGRTQKRAKKEKAVLIKKKILIFTLRKLIK